MRLARNLVLAALLAVPALAPSALAQTAAPRQPTVSVTGTGEAELKPDFAHLHVTVATQGDTVSQAASANRTASERVLARLQDLGVKKEDIRTEGFQVNRNQPAVGPDGREIKTPKFSASHRLRIVSRDLDGVGRLAGEILASGDMLFESVSFGLDRQEEGEDRARAAAVKDARRQAEVYAGAAGVALGRLMEIRDGAAHPFAPQPELRAATAMAKGAPAESVPLVPPATLRYHASVQLVFELAQKP